MDDDEISCPVPQTALSGRPSDTLYCHMFVRMMQLSSKAKKLLSSARALKQSPEQFIEVVANLNKELDDLKRFSKNHFCLDNTIDSCKLPEGMTLRQAQSLQSYYFCLALDVNTPIAYPWSATSVYARENLHAAIQVESSLNTVARVSRSAILATRQLRVDASCSSLYVLTEYRPSE